MDHLSMLFTAIPIVGGFVLERAEDIGHWPIRKVRRAPPLWLAVLVLMLLAIASIAAALLYPDALEPAYF